ncbi:hypothetical protein GCM10009687_68050 [Asanoa iriomotensis]|uniref:Uncharacterized protein n=1 Tax=Asanoa iriomotensis TaxID=234613 RepID=A0ABQ4C5F6_9ACTN|nr:hypothetical protein Air01nite_40900 [Asanoa iriomotensis]
MNSNNATVTPTNPNAIPLLPVRFNALPIPPYTAVNGADAVRANANKLGHTKLRRANPRRPAAVTERVLTAAPPARPRPAEPGSPATYNPPASDAGRSR